MLAYEAADGRFVLLHGELAAAQAGARLQRTPADDVRGVVVQHEEAARAYYLFTPAEMDLLLATAPPGGKLAELVAELGPATVLAPYDPASAAQRAVVVDHGHPLGVILTAEAPVTAEPDAAPGEDERAAEDRDAPPIWEALAPDIAEWAPLEPAEWAPLSSGETLSAEFSFGEAAAAEPSPPIPKDLIPPPASMPEARVSEGAAPEDAAPATLQPRALVASGPEAVAVDEVATVLVSLSAVGESPAGSLPVTLAERGSLDVLIRPVQGFAVEGANLATITTAGPEATLPVLFKLRATGLGVGVAQIYAFQAGQPLGYLTYTAEIRESAAAGQEAATIVTLSPAQSAAPDLTLLILEEPVNGETEITFRLTAVDPTLGLNLKPFGPIRLRTAPQQYFQEFFRDIERLPLESEADARTAQRRVERKGAHLFQTLLPPELQTLLWSLRERIHAVQIQSEEPWIPWELCKLLREEADGVVEGPFLCEAFAMTRWIPGVGQQPALTLGNIGLIAPGDSGLAFAQHEVDFISSLAQETRTITRVPASYLDVTDALIAGTFDVLHFTGHGVFRAPDPNHSAMELENGEQLVPEDLSGLVRNLGKARPLVFLNACQLGRSDLSLTDVGGWAPQFLRAGAAAFIGAYWSVYDDSALAFARTVYGELLAGATIADAVQKARRAAQNAGDPSWLAYTVFAHPAARVTQ